MNKSYIVRLDYGGGDIRRFEFANMSDAIAVFDHAPCDAMLITRNWDNNVDQITRRK